ncbi:hypothetical protein THAOC_03800 [Thalassiosira oceanica]|uniref:Uncharacterized protein n=1 Tax=Thalassiosira oceanica TaxID=159749 RepID=K0TKD5_THAOC|nr:hypothetical protein THAOC_03800 [Thalassiosira oceanica]|eukprot:EJK74516.1 hypothetical protein THAOC_03800 [Thalassiosira oceanica]
MSGRQLVESMHQPIGLGADDDAASTDWSRCVRCCQFPSHIVVHIVDGSAGKAPVFDLAAFRGRSGPALAIETPEQALPMYHMGTAITPDHPPRPLGARHRLFPSDLVGLRSLAFA